MGLLSKVTSSIGVVKNKVATALSGLKKTGVGRVATSVIKSPVGKVGGMLVKRAGYVGAAITAVSLVGSALKKKNAKNKPKVVTAAQGVNVAKKAGLSIPKVLGIGAAAITGGYLVEKVAEKLGVRGGAGFIGKRKTKRKGRGRYMTIRVPRNRRGQGSISKTEERRLRNLARNYSYSDGSSRRSRRKRKGKNMKSYMKWVRSHRRRK